MRSENEIRKRLVESDRNLMGIKESTYYDMEMLVNFTLQWVLYEGNVEDSLIDVIFLDLYISIRGNWGYGLKPRIDKMKEILSKTTLDNNKKEWFKNHLESMEKHIDDTIEHDGRTFKTFDGRGWSRDAEISYDDLKADKNWFDKEFYEKYSTYDLFS